MVLLVFNKVISWCNKSRKKALIFKFEFEKAYDLVSWDLLYKVMEFMGFGPNC